MARQRRGERPRVRHLIQAAQSRNTPGEAAQPGGRDALDARTGTVEQIEDCKGNIPPLPFEGLCRKLTRPGGRLRGGAMACQTAQAVELAPGDDPPRVLGGRTENAARIAVIVRQRAEGEGEVGLLEVVAAHERHEEVGLTRRPSGGQSLGESARQHGLPDLAPDLPDGAPQRFRMSRASAQRYEGVVVDIDELRTQAHGAGGAGGEDEVQGMAPAERPTLHRTDRCFRPVESLEALGHLARIPSHPPAPLLQFQSFATRAE